MESSTHTLNRWSTNELMEEVIRRSASEGPALHDLEAVVIRARLAESDRRFEARTQLRIGGPLQFRGVGGTTEIAFAADED
jgi:hypothetical protein